MKKIFILLIIILFSFELACGGNNTNEPAYIKQLTAYKEGDGIVVYFILADKNGQPTTFNGMALLQIICGNDEPAGIPVYYIAKEIKQTDFYKTSIGKGAFEHKELLYSFGRFPYSSLLYNLKKYRNGEFKKAEIEYTNKIDKILSSSLEHQVGKVIIYLIGGNGPSYNKFKDSCLNPKEPMDFYHFAIKIWGASVIYEDILKHGKKESFNFMDSKESFLF